MDTIELLSEISVLKEQLSKSVEVVRSDCTGCRFVGTYDTQFPCANCARKTKDYYEPQKRCGNCKFLTYRWGKVWCDIRCENPTVDVCDKWKRSE